MDCAGCFNEETRGRAVWLRRPAPPYGGVVARADLDKQPTDVRRMFDAVAQRYDVTNDVLSLGQDRRWRREVIRAVERLALANGAVIQTGAEVVEITTTDAVATGVRLAGGRRIPADLVVSTADLHHTETALLPPPLQTYPEKWWAKRTPSPGALLLLLGVEGEN